MNASALQLAADSGRASVTTMTNRDISRAKQIADRLGARLTFASEGITIEGRRFVNHVATILEFFAWAAGYEAALATMDKLYVRDNGSAG